LKVQFFNEQFVSVIFSFRVFLLRLLTPKANSGLSLNPSNATHRYPNDTFLSAPLSTQ
jgi:hypothetical protein